MDSAGQQSPTFRPVPAVRRPVARLVGLKLPISGLETRIGLANVVQKGKRLEACVIYRSQRAAGCPIQGTLDGMARRQCAQAGSDIGHVIQKWVDRLHLTTFATPKLAPGWPSMPQVLSPRCNL